MKALILIESPKELHQFEEVDVILEDGGVVSIRHNGKCILSDYYQTRIDVDAENIWEQVGEGKMYCKEWDSGDIVTHEMILDALNWLCMLNEGFDIIYEFTTVDPVHRIKEFLMQNKK